MNKPTAFIFFGILLVGLTVSFFTLRGCREKHPVASHSVGEVPAGIASIPPSANPSAGSSANPSAPGAPSNPTAPTSPPAAGAAAGKSATTKAAPKGGTAKAAAPKPGETGKPASPKGTAPGTDAPVFKTTEAALTAIADKIQAKDFSGLVGISQAGAIPAAVRERVKKLVEDPALKLDPGKPRVEISKSVGGLRWAFNLVRAAGGDPSGEGPSQLYVDLVERPDETIDIVKLSLPWTPHPPQDGDASGAGADTVAADALSVAHAFAQAVVRRDFKTARLLADPTAVTDERVAALMIAIEEGKFELKEDRPLVVTLARDDVTWVLSRVESPGMAASEFAVELAQFDRSWKVNGLTFSKVLSTLSEAAGAGAVAYNPIVENPSGGDSLVLYFEFDEASLTPRTDRQLAIVAEILKQSKDRVIRISGHADALGSDSYNEALSDRRAETIRQALLAKGAGPEQVVTEAFGATKPRKPNFLPDGSDNPRGRSANRRAEVLLDF